MENMEQFKMILEAATSAGESAFWLAVMWLAKDLILNFTIGGLLLTVASLGYKLLKRVIERNSVIRAVREKMGYNEYDNLPPARMIQWINTRN